MIKRMALSAMETKYNAGTFWLSQPFSLAQWDVINFTVAQGDTATTRDGSSITLLGMKVNIPLIGGDTNNYVRVAMTYTPQRAMVLADLPASTRDFWGLTAETALRYKVLYDRRFKFHADGGGTNTKFIKMRVNLKGLKMVYDGAGVQTKGFLQIWAISDSLAIPHPGVETTKTCVYKMYFKDI